VYADDAFLLRGNWICGGSMGISTAAGALGRPGCAVSVFWPAVEVGILLWARAPLRHHFVNPRAHFHFFLSSV
jgi:hypothetical protein